MDLQACTAERALVVLMAWLSRLALLIPPSSPALAASAAGTPTNVSADDVPINSGFKMPDARISAGEARPSLHLFLRFVNGQFHSVKCSLITFQQ